MEEVIQRLFLDGGIHPKVILCVPMSFASYGMYGAIPEYNEPLRRAARRWQSHSGR
jgi:hypothetical protein